MPKGRVGVIGLGSIGSRRARILAKMGYEVIGIDSNNNVPTPEGVQRTATLYNLWGYEPMAVLICTPPDSHATLIWQAYQQNCPAFVEKPLALNFTAFPVDKAWVNMVACNWRFHPGPAILHHWIEDGRLGRVLSVRLWHSSYLPDWVPGRDYKRSYVAQTGVILDVGSHLVDLAFWLSGPGKLVTSMGTFAESIGLSCDGTAELLLIHDSKAISSVGMSFEQTGYDMGIKVVGTEGTANWQYGKGCHMGEGPSYLTDEDESEMQESSYQDEMAHFLNCCSVNVQTCNPISEAVKVLSILLEAKRCAQSV